MGDEQSVLRSFKNASRGAKTFERDLGKTARGALAATVSFKGLGRSVAFASSYFLGGAGFAYLLKSSVGHAEDLEKAQRSLAVVIRKTGGNVAQTLPDLEKFAKAQADVGISAVQAEQGLARASAITGSTTAGLRAYREALVISKATGKSFNMVLIAAAKANNGQTTALARYIGKIAKGTSAQKLYNDVSARYGGQAQANTSATEKLGAALTNVETTVGVALLPTINHYATALSDWLGKSKNQERVQRDVNTVVHDAAGIFRTVAGAVKKTSDVVGGFKNLVELLLAFKLTGWALGIGRSFGLIGTQATIANGEVVALRASLLSISGMAIAPIVIPLIVDEVIHGKHGLLSRAATAGSNAVSGALGFGNSANGQGPTYQQYLNAAKHHDANFEIIKGFMKRAGITDPRRLRGGPLAPVRKPDTHIVDTRISARGPSGPVLTGSGTTAPLDRRSQIDNAVQQARTALASGDKSAKARLIAALKQQIDFDKKYAAIQEKLAARGGPDAKKHADTMRQLLADEASAYDEIASLAAKDAATGKKKAAAAKKAWAEYLKSLKNRVAAAGLTKGVGDDIAALKAEIAAIKAREKKHGKTPELEAARIAAQKQLQAANKKKPITTFALPFKLQLDELKAETTKTTADDLKVAQAQKSFAEKMIKSGKLRGQALLDAWSEIIAANSKIADLQNQQTQHVTQTSSRLLTAGLNLTKAQRVALESRYSQALAHGGAAPTGVGALGQNVTINVHGAGDPNMVAKAVAARLAKIAKQNSGQTRGVRAGSYLGHH